MRRRLLRVFSRTAVLHPHAYHRGRVVGGATKKSPNIQPGSSHQTHGATAIRPADGNLMRFHARLIIKAEGADHPKYGKKAITEFHNPDDLKPREKPRRQFYTLEKIYHEAEPAGYYSDFHIRLGKLCILEEKK